MVYADGSVYVGEFSNNIPHGIGELEYVNKDKYKGQFHEAMKWGNGNYFYAEGTVFSGRWEEDNKIEGELILFNGDTFKGTFRNN